MNYLVYDSTHGSKPITEKSLRWVRTVYDMDPTPASRLSPTIAASGRDFGYLTYKRVSESRFQPIGHHSF